MARSGLDYRWLRRNPRQPPRRPHAVHQFDRVTLRSIARSAQRRLMGRWDGVVK